MKKIILSLLLCLISHTLYAQDIITFRDGKSVKAKVLEITQTEIKYKRFSNLDGPLYTINKNTVTQIQYKGGDIEEFSNEPVASSSTSSSSVASNPNAPQLIEVEPDERNAEIIRQSRYGSNGCGDMFPKRTAHFKPADCAVAKLVFTESSVVSTSEVEVLTSNDWMKPKGALYAFLGVNIALKNKTDKVIYVDLGNSFSTDKFTTRCYYDPSKVVSINDGKTSGSSLNLGAVAGVFGLGGTIVGRLASGVNVGSAETGGTTTTYSPQQYVAIPPGGRGYISKWEKEYDGPIRREGESILREGESFKLLLKSVGINKNDSKVFSEANSPCKRDYYITYSTDPQFKTYSVVRFSVYIHQIVGAYPGLIDIPEGICTTYEVFDEY